MSDATCQRCGAAVRGLVCEYCGVLHHAPTSAAEEKEAWIEFLSIMQTKEPEVQIRMLQSGFLPDSVPILIDAGLHCVGLLNTSSTADELVQAAHLRLQAIAAKLKILPSTPESERAVAELLAASQRYQQADRRFNQALIFISVTFLLACGGWLFWLVMS